MFFATLEFKESGHIFERLGVNSLPLLLRIPGRLNIRRTGQIDIGNEDKMTSKSHQEYPWSAETIAEFVGLRTGIIGPFQHTLCASVGTKIQINLVPCFGSIGLPLIPKPCTLLNGMFLFIRACTLPRC